MLRPVGVTGKYQDVPPLGDAVILTNVHSALDVVKKGKNPGEGGKDQKRITATVQHCHLHANIARCPQMQMARKHICIQTNCSPPHDLLISILIQSG